MRTRQQALEAAQVADQKGADQMGEVPQVASVQTQVEAPPKPVNDAPVDADAGSAASASAASNATATSGGKRAAASTPVEKDPKKKK